MENLLSQMWLLLNEEYAMFCFLYVFMPHL